MWWSNKDLENLPRYLMKIIAPDRRVALILDWIRISKITAVIVEKDVKIIDFSPEKEFSELIEHIGKKMAELGE